VTAQEQPPEPFQEAVASLRSVRLRHELTVEEAPAPQRLAPFAIALTADVVDGADEELGTGRFVVLHDPDGHSAWNGTFRVVTFARATLEPDMASDPLVTEIGWAWLMDCLADQKARFHDPSGTVTRESSDSFGAMADRPSVAALEVRASWTPDTPDIGDHLTAWADLLCTACGLPPVPPGVVTLPRRAASRRLG
jgi:hypothetical protein